VCVIIARKEKLANNVLASFKDDLAVGGLRRTFNVLFNKCIDTFPTISAVSNLHWMLTRTKMNTYSLGWLLPMYVEDFGLA
jgi:hypothetical protein